MRRHKHKCLPLALSQQCLHVGHCCANDVGIDLISKCFIPLKWHQSAQSSLMSLCVLDAPKTESHTVGNTRCGFFSTSVEAAVPKKVCMVTLYWPSRFDWSPCGWQRAQVLRRSLHPAAGPDKIMFKHTARFFFSFPRYLSRASASATLKGTAHQN